MLLVTSVAPHASAYTGGGRTQTMTLIPSAWRLHASLGLLVALSCGVMEAIQTAPSAPVTPPTLVSKAAAYLGGYLRALSSVVCEERYEQRVETLRQGRDDKGGLARVSDVHTRQLISDFLLVQLPGIRGWYEFRDVYRVDGTDVRNRNDRLMKLFVEPHADRFTQADLIADESSRYNLGIGARDTNVPTFALQLLMATVVRRFAFSLGVTEVMEGITAQVVSFMEVARPTIVRGDHDTDVPATGQFWIEPVTGAILKTRFETKSGPVQTRIDVTYGLEPRLGLRVPAVMEERREAVGEVLTGRATYGNFRRFTVETNEQIKKN